VGVRLIFLWAELDEIKETSFYTMVLPPCYPALARCRWKSSAFRGWIKRYSR